MQSHATGAATAETDAGSQVERARRALAENPTWYHTMELAPGVVTPGQVDQRDLPAKLLPDDLSGLRALDIGTFDGFWAFEMEKRGAEVVAIDVETIDAAQWPPINRERLKREVEANQIELGRGFRLAKELYGSSAERVICSVNDLTPEAIGGPVDFIFEGALLLHLRDPVGALERARLSLRPGGRMVLWESISLRETLLAPRRPVARFGPVVSDFTWWLPNYNTIATMPLAAGFASSKRIAVARLKGRNKRMRNLFVGIEARVD